jgi:hypothetical protein
MSAQQPFSPHYGSNQVLTAGAAALSADIDATNAQVRIVNTGANIAYVRTYSSRAAAAVASTADLPIAAGAAKVFTKSLEHDKLSYISAAGTTLQMITGEGYTGDSGGDISAVAATMTATTGSKTGGTAAASSTLVGAVYNSTPPTLTNGQQAALQSGVKGQLLTSIVDVSNNRVVQVSSMAADGGATTDNALLVQARLFNGTTMDRMRGTTDGLQVIGSAAHSAASAGAPVRVAGRVNTAVETTLAAGDASDLFVTTGGALVTKPYAVPDVDWSYAAAASGIANTTTAVTVKTAGAAGVRNYITGISLSTDALGAATEFCIRDGAGGTVLWRIKIGTAGIVNPVSIAFPTPLRGTAATLLEVVTLTASITGSVYVNMSGYQAP